MIQLAHQNGTSDSVADFTRTRGFSGNPPGQATLSSDKLLALMYDKLRRLASSKMMRESGFQTLQPTALVHEAWLRISPRSSAWSSDAHFMGAAAEAMRRVLVDRSRARAAVKRTMPGEPPDEGMTHHNHILAIHEGLKRLEAEDKRAAEIVTLKFFSGFTTEEIATMKGSNVRSIERQWTFAKARLYQIIREDLQKD
jgi:RNA polymerase sigma factor (TIGR02999 family)